MLKKEGKHTTAVQGSERTNFVEHEDDASTKTVCYNRDTVSRIKMMRAHQLC